MDLINKIKPVFVTAIGRSGTTLLMHILSTNNKFYFEDVYPYETRSVAYLSRACNLINFDYSILGRKPHFNFPVNLYDIPEEEDFEKFDGLWNIFEINICRHSPSVLYYAEKSVGLLEYSFLKKFNPVTIQLIRDPRDIILSVNKFNQKRKLLAFSWERNDTIVTYAKKMIPVYREMLKRIKINTPSKIVLRYEDLIQHPADIIRKLNKCLHTDIIEKTVINIISDNKTFKHHRTSRTSLSSVFRWKDELDPSIVKIINSELHQELLDAGYETD